MRQISVRKKVRACLVISLLLVLIVAGCTLFPPKDDDPDPDSILKPGKVLVGVDGVTVGAPEGALEEEIEIAIAKEEDPTGDIPLPGFLEGVQLSGAFTV